MIFEHCEANKYKHDLFITSIILFVSNQINIQLYRFDYAKHKPKSVNIVLYNNI
jgi:hypothetical protein